MSQISLYFDEDAGQHSVVQEVRSSGVDVLTTLEANNLNHSDEEQLLWSTEGLKNLKTGSDCGINTLPITPSR